MLQFGSIKEDKRDPSRTKARGKYRPKNATKKGSKKGGLALDAEYSTLGSNIQTQNSQSVSDSQKQFLWRMDKKTKDDKKTKEDNKMKNDTVQKEGMKEVIAETPAYGAKRGH